MDFIQINCHNNQLASRCLISCRMTCASRPMLLRGIFSSAQFALRQTGDRLSRRVIGGQPKSLQRYGQNSVGFVPTKIFGVSRHANARYHDARIDKKRRRFRGAPPLRRNKVRDAAASKWRDHGLGEIMNPQAMAGHQAVRRSRFDDRNRKRCQRMIFPPSRGRLPGFGPRRPGSGYEIGFGVVDEGAKMAAFGKAAAHGRLDLPAPEIARGQWRRTLHCHGRRRDRYPACRAGNGGAAYEGGEVLLGNLDRGSCSENPQEFGTVQRRTRFVLCGIKGRPVERVERSFRIRRLQAVRGAMEDKPVLYFRYRRGAVLLARMPFDAADKVLEDRRSARAG